MKIVKLTLFICVAFKTCSAEFTYSENVDVNALNLMVNFTVEDCSDYRINGHRSGVYRIQPIGAARSFLVFCDMDFEGGKWTVLQNRFNGEVDFYRSYEQYADGFGDINGEYWSGLELMYQLTSRANYQLHVQLKDFENEIAYAAYTHFFVDSRDDGYRLRVSNYTGNAGDSLSTHNMRKFSARDVDNDAYINNCAEMFQGAWWYNQCLDSNLNGRYLRGQTVEYPAGVVWKSWKGLQYSLMSTRMMIRPMVHFREAEELRTECSAPQYLRGLEKRLAHTEELLKRINRASHHDCSQEEPTYPTDCSYVKSSTSGVYKIRPVGTSQPFPVYCDMDLLHEKWTVIQNRFNGKIDFYRKFSEYEYGFGNLEGEHWLGLYQIHEITKTGEYELHVQLTDFDNNTRFARYGEFSVGAPDTYKLTIDKYSGNAGDSMELHKRMFFSTYDHDADKSKSDNCAAKSRGGWWYNSCRHSNLNGPYGRGRITEYYRGVVWYHFRGHLYSLKSSKMLIRRTYFP